MCLKNIMLRIYCEFATIIIWFYLPPQKKLLYAQRFMFFFLLLSYMPWDFNIYGLEVDFRVSIWLKMVNWL